MRTVVLDSLTSSVSHDFTQTWHLFPGATLTTQGLDVLASGPPAATLSGPAVPLLAVIQAKTQPTTLTVAKGQDAPPMHGFASVQYGHTIQNYHLGYHATGDGDLRHAPLVGHPRDGSGSPDDRLRRGLRGGRRVRRRRSRLQITVMNPGVGDSGHETVTVEPPATGPCP